MLIRLAHKGTHTYEIKHIARWQLEEVFKQFPDLEKVDVLKISRTITRRKILG